MVASEGPAQSVPLVAQTTTFDAGRTERDAAGRSPTSTSQAHPDAVMMASAGAAQSVPSETQAVVPMTAASPAGLDVALAMPEGVAQSMPPTA